MSTACQVPVNLCRPVVAKCGCVGFVGLVTNVRGEFIYAGGLCSV
jgi:hypothetical protein